MTTLVASGFEKVVGNYHHVVAELVKGNPEEVKSFFSHREDVTLENPYSGIMHGWKSVQETVALAALLYREGTVTFENIVKNNTSDMGYIVEIEEHKAKLGGRSDVSTVSLRVTSIFGFEDDGWKLVHRHADPLASVKSTESFINDNLCVGSRCYF